MHCYVNRKAQEPIVETERIGEHPTPPGLD